MSDWFESICKRTETLQEQLRISPLSRAWRSGGSTDNVQILSTVRSMAFNLGVPQATQIRFAHVGDVGAAAAGFEDLPEFNQPFILLDREYCDSDKLTAEEQIDVCVGLGLHEAGHILFTREGYLRKFNSTLSRRQILYDNLLEDERIEELLRKHAPGYRLYLEKTRSELLEHGLPGAALRRFSSLPDLDKIENLVFSFIRLPHLISEEIMRWRAINEECVFRTLLKILPSAPDDEEAVAQLALALTDLVLRLRQLYPQHPEDVVAPEFNTDKSVFERSLKQLAANIEDRVADWSGDADTAADRLFEEARRLEEVADQCQDPRQAQAAAERLLEKAAEISAGVPPESRGRFSWREAAEVLEQAATIQESFAEGKSSDPGVAHQHPRMVIEDAWEWVGSRRTEVEYPNADAAGRAKYDQALSEVRPHVVALRRVFQLRASERTRTLRERKIGRLDTRRLAQASFEPRIYRTTCRETAPGLALCLLLDESGSMSGDAEEQTLRVAVLIAEATRGIPGIELEIYSHSTCGADDRDCRIKYLFGKRNPNPAAIADYESGGANYDHQAIQAAGRMFRDNTAQAEARVMLVISDGAPNGTDYGGAPAIAATREAVNTLRRSRVAVFNVAIDDYHSEDIFGAAFVLKFTDLDTLLPSFRTLLTRIVRQYV